MSRVEFPRTSENSRHDRLEVEKEAELAIPLRTKLYSVPMLGGCGHTQESIVDYAIRIAYKHSVGAVPFFKHVVMPEAGLHATENHRGLTVTQVAGFAGLSERAAKFTGTLERLTGVKDLARGTLLPWNRMLGARGLHAGIYRRWCAHCLADRESNGEIYFSLLWAFEPARVCPLHKIVLNDSCAACGRKQPILGNSHLAGQCKFCSTKLSFANGGAATERDLYVSRALGQLVDPRNLMYRDLFTQRQFRFQVERMTNTLNFKTPKAMSEALRFPLSLGENGTSISLVQLLDFSFRLGVMPVDFLRGVVEHPRPLLSLQRTQFTSPQMGRSERLAQEALVAHALARVLSDFQEVVPVSKFVKQIGIPMGTFRQNHENATRSLVEHSRRVRAEHLERKKRKVAAAVAEMVAAGGPFGGKTKHQVLISAGLHFRSKRDRDSYDGFLRAALEKHGSEGESKAFEENATAITA